MNCYDSRIWVLKQTRQYDIREKTLFVQDFIYKELFRCYLILLRYFIFRFCKYINKKKLDSFIFVYFKTFLVNDQIHSMLNERRN